MKNGIKVWIVTAVTILAVIGFSLGNAIGTSNTGIPLYSNSVINQSSSAIQYNKEVRFSNLTMPDAPNLEQSYYPVHELPLIPNTTPITYHLLNNFTGYSTGGIFIAPPMPSGGWDLILLNFSISVTGGVWDVDHNVWMNNIEVLFGTLPEYGTATVLKNITEYEYALQGAVHWYVREPYGFVSKNASHHVYLSVSFYPPASGIKPPTEPNMVIPLWNYTTLNPKTETNTVIANIPTNTTRAILELYPYGYNVDEEWYADEPSFRAVNISVNNVSLAYALPFPYINTGGINLFAWRPLTASYTLDNRPITIDLTGALGFIEGTKNWTVSIAPTVTSGSYWHITGDLLIYTNSSALKAKLINYLFNNFKVQTYQTPNTTLYVSPLAYYNQTATANYKYSSEIIGSSGIIETASTDTSLFFVDDQLITPVWENVTSNEITSTTTSIATNGTTTIEIDTLSFPLQLQSGAYFTQTGTWTYNGATYPIGNITVLLNNFYQTFNSSSIISTITPNGTTVSISYFNNTALVPLSEWIGILKFTSPTSAIITSLVFNDASTIKLYNQYNTINDPNHIYMHTIAGSDYINNATVANTSNNVETIYTNTISRGFTISYFETMLSTLNVKIQNLKTQVVSYQLEIKNLSADLNTTSTLLKNVKLQLNETLSSLANTRTQLSIIWAEYNESNIRNTELEQNLINDQKEINNLTGAVNSLILQVKSSVPMNTYYMALIIAIIVTAIVTFTGTILYYRKKKS
ncbi:MAG: peptide-N4-asparagine amidase [Thermoproteota archaeon]